MCMCTWCHVYVYVRVYVRMDVGGCVQEAVKIFLGVFSVVYAGMCTYMSLFPASRVDQVHGFEAKGWLCAQGVKHLN